MRHNAQLNGCHIDSPAEHVPGERRLLLFALPVVLMWLVAAVPQHAAGESCTELLQGRCETCHYLTRVCERVEKNQGRSSWFGGTAGSWKRIIHNMVRQGAKLNGAEEEQLVGCLSVPAPEVLDICGLKK